MDWTAGTKPIYVLSYSQVIILIILDAELYKLFDEKKTHPDTAVL